MDKQIITTLDLGSTKTICLIASIGNNSELEVIGHGVSKTEGMKKGILVNLDRTVNSITNAKNDAEDMAGISVKSCFLGITGQHIKSFNESGLVAIQDPNNEITETDINRVVQASRRMTLPIDREIIQVIPQEFKIDEQEGFINPVGLTGSKLESKVHIVTGTKSMLQNIRKALEHAGFEDYNLVPQPYATSFGILDNEEKDRGILLLDIGGGTTDMALFFNGSVRYTSVITRGGNDITNDIAIGVQCPLARAEELKKVYGSAIASKASENNMFQIGGSGRTTAQEGNSNLLASIIEPRLEEILTMVNQELERFGYSKLLIGGLVLTGGTSMMKNAVDLAESIFGRAVRIGNPKAIKGITDRILNPTYATSVGLLLYASQNIQTDGEYSKVKDNFINNLIEKSTESIKKFFKDFI